MEQVQSILSDVTGPFLLKTKKRTYSQASVEAKISSELHDMTARYHICFPFSEVNTEAQRLKLRPAEIDDELDGGILSLNQVWPKYNREYKDRFATNSRLTTIRLNKDCTLMTRMKAIAN